MEHAARSHGGEDVAMSERGRDGIYKPDDESVRNKALMNRRRNYYILSDDKNPSEDEMDLIASRSHRQISLGPKILHADHAITVLHNVLDRMESVE